MKSRTKDELLLIQLAEVTSQEPIPVDPVKVAESIGISPKACKTIVNTLAQANFVKKCTDHMIIVTKNGLSLVEHLKEQN